MLISQIKWSPSDTLFEIGGFSIYMYSLMFVVAFVLGYQLVKSFFTKERIDHKYLDPMLLYMVISTFLGARLGEVFFYNWGYFQNHLIEILSHSRIQQWIHSWSTRWIQFVGFRGLQVMEQLLNYID